MSSKTDINSWKGAVIIAASAIAAEHFFTFSLPSLPTTREFFAGTEEGRAQIRRAYWIATGLSLSLAGLMSWKLKSSTPLLITGVLAFVFHQLYEQALTPPVAGVLALPEVV